MLSRNFLFWKKVPFFRILVPFIGGIIIQIHLELPLFTIEMLSFISIVSFLVFPFAPAISKFRWLAIRGVILNLLIVSFGCIVVSKKTIKNSDRWIGHLYNENSTIIARLDEPLVEKSKSYKAEAYISLLIGNEILHAQGKIILYIEKTDSHKLPGFGSKLIFKKKLQPIRNSGNPGGFDYRRYCEFQGIYFQVYLNEKEFHIIPGTQGNLLKKIIYTSRHKVLEILRSFITSRKEAGVAEALLVGYRNDLDKELVQAYSNTGVVHIIAISGLHLGLIYGILILLLKSIKKYRRLNALRSVLIIFALWAFSLLSGGSASVLRSALMFSVLIIGDTGNLKTSMFNSLAASAFLLLSFNPFFLWDVGFQLSYAAVVSILLFMKPIDNWVYFSNKFLQKFWSLNAITLSAQVLTVPLVMFHFHQFPTLFLAANLVAVPLSSCILLGEILLCTIYFVSPFAELLGRLLITLIKAMNEFIEKINSYSFAVISGIQLGIAQTACLYGMLLSIAWWLLQKSKPGFMLSLGFLLLLLTSHSFYRLQNSNKRKIIVYNVPKLRAIDLIHGRLYFFKGDSILEHNQNLQDYYLKPARTLYHAMSTLGVKEERSNSFLFESALILLVDENFVLPTSNQKIKADLIVLSANAKPTIAELDRKFILKIIVADASNSLWKIRLWKRDAERLHLRFHSVPEQGAFVMDL